MKLVAALLGIASLAGAPAATHAGTQDLDGVIKPYAADQTFMGSVLVAQGDQVIFNKAYGFADAGWNIPNGTDTEFDIGSLTKQFTAALVLLLQEDGRLSLSDPVGKFLPDAPPAWRQITIAQLLGHTSGIPDLWSDQGFDAWSMSPRTPADIVAYFRDKPLQFEPGSQYRYSSTGYIVVGLILEKASGRPYGDLLRDRIFQPLGMTHSGLDADSLILKKRARGYTISNGKLVQERPMSMSVGWSAGAIYSTTGDLLRWEQGLYGGKLLSTASLKAMTTPGKGGYGLGINVNLVDGETIYRHLGAFQGFNATLSYLPSKRIAVIVLGNVNPPRVIAPLMTDKLVGVAKAAAHQ